ncbi:MAG: methyl-accepting chemotaxis protein [Candidatus Omnitrophota bacterium]
MKIKIKLLLSYFLLSLVPLLIVGAAAFYNASNALIDQARQQLISIADKSVEQIDFFLGVVQSNVRELSRMPDSRMVYMFKEFDQDLSPILQRFKKYSNDNSYILSIRIVDLNGNEVISTDKTQKMRLDFAKYPWMQEALKSQDIFNSNIIVSEVLSVPVIEYAVQIVDDRGVKKGLLLVQIDVKKVTIFVDEITTGQTGYGYIINKSGVVIAHPKKEKIFKENLSKNDSREMVEIVKKMISGDRGIGVYTYENVRKYVFYVPYPKQQWSVAITLPVQELMQSSRQILGIILGLGCLVLVGVVLMALRMSNGITRPIQSIVDVMAVLADQSGDLTKRLKVESNDEVGEMAKQFNKFMDSLQSMLIKVRDVSEKVNSLSEMLSSTSQEINASTEEISTIFQRMSAGVTNQVKGTEEATEIILQMVQSLKEAAKNAGEGATSSMKTSDLAKEGMSSAKEAVERTTRIITVAAEISKIVGLLGTRSTEIGRIVDVITGISSQTNMLSLNAAIEAARAGESGRGFAVVAEEVRKLADSSSQAAKQIALLIRSIQTETSQAVESVKTATTAVDEGQIIINAVSVGLKEILKAAEFSALQAQFINDASNAQLKYTQRVDETIKKGTKFSHETVDSIEDSTNSMHGITASMQEMTASAQDLSQMAVGLRTLVNKFKL